MASEKEAEMMAALAGIQNARTRAMYERYIAGGTLAEAGVPFRLSRERVRQIFRDAELPQRTLAETMALKRDLEARDNQTMICHAFKESRDIDEVATRLGVARTVVKAVVETSFPAGQRRRKKAVRQKYSDDELLGFLRQASERLGGVVTTQAYNGYAKARRTRDGRPWPTQQTHFKRFGSWRAALAAAGLAANPPSAIAGQRLFDEAHCIDAVRALARQLGKVPTAGEYDAFAKASAGAFPSQATVRNRCGTWNAVLNRAGL
jgi:hypothetical protein